MERVFSHSGDAGDLLAHLPVIRGLGGGRLVLFPAACTGYRMDQKRAEGLIPLLTRQPYLASVEWRTGPEGVNLDHWRNRYRSGLNLTDMACDTFGAARPHRELPWLWVDPRPVAPVVIARSPRYRQWNFPWDRVYQQYGRDAVFVGLPDEHREFEDLYGPIRYHLTPTMLELAEVIAGADLFVGNQSSPFWLAEGLKVPTLLEIANNPNNCHWERAAAQHGWSREWLGELTPVEQLRARRLAGVVARADGHTLLTHDRLSRIADLVERTRRLPGDAAELGVFRGGSAKVIAGVAPEKTLHLFDTFAGIPEDDAEPAGHRAGEFAATETSVREYLAGENVRFHAGRFPETTTGLSANARYSFAHVDGDTYQTTRAALEYFWPRLTPGGVIVLDDYDWPHCPGVARAVAEILPGVRVEVAGQHAWLTREGG